MNGLRNFSLSHLVQVFQFCTGGRIGLAKGMIYFSTGILFRGYHYLIYLLSLNSLLKDSITFSELKNK